MNGEKVLDVRAISPRDRHPRIFQTFDDLAPNSSFTLVNDHDPKPLFYQFSFERAEQFGWDYLEQGPEVWKVKITRTKQGKEEEKSHKSGGGCYKA